MEEELNEHDLEERLYAMLHHVDETAANITSEHNNGLNIVENALRSTVRRYWRTSEPSTPFHKSNTPKLPAATNKQTVVNKTNQQQQTRPKEEKSKSPIPPTPDLSIFQSTTPQSYRKSIEIMENDVTNEVLLETSDEDEVIEVAIPPKPTITIESSDEDELMIVQPQTPSKKQDKINPVKTPQSQERGISASPVPSVVSSVSDEFIRSDCIALNISSRQPDNPSFDFSLHGSDLIEQNTPAKKKKKKKSKEAVTSTPVGTINNTPTKPICNDAYFATPKSKAKNKNQKAKTPVVAEKSIPSADIYDSDSNHSVDMIKNKSYTVSDKSLPSTDVYESDSNLSETREKPKQIKKNNLIGSDSTPLDRTEDELMKTSDRNKSTLKRTNDTISFVDLTDTENLMTVDQVEESDIQESIVMGNVSGFPEDEEYGDDFPLNDSGSQFGSTKIPAILNEDLDFDNLKGKDKVCKRRRYSLTALRAEMEKFYNESWGGENFNHREIQKNMSRDKSLWVIDPKDRMPPLNKRKVTCNYCNRAGHRDDTCRLKPAVCYMCGSTGHYEPRCPRKICVNCGSPNQMYSSMCRNCSHWGSIVCNECGQRGHPHTHCPDLWRRYHSTIDNNVPLERCQTKKPHQMYCSGCTRRGHLVHSCRIAIPFSGLPVFSPYVCLYRPVYPPSPKQTQNNPITPASPKHDRNKRQSKSPTAHETHLNKKRNISASEDNKSPVANKSINQRPQEAKKDPKNVNTNKDQSPPSEAMDFIPIESTNHDKKGNMIQDNEVSDTSDVVTSARIYVTNDIIAKLQTPDGEKWLKETSEEHNVEVEYAAVTSFLSIKGLLGDQEAFQAKLRDWVKPAPSQKSASTHDAPSDNPGDHDSNSIPKNRNNLLRHLNKALESLKEDLGDPRAIYKEIQYLRKRHEKLLKQKVINPKVLKFNRTNLNLQLQKLNMVLLGQAGLAGGRKHLDELYSLQEKLKNFRHKNISSEMHNEIEEHYSSIFCPIQREDFSDLLKMYNASTLTKKKKKKKGVNLNPKLNRLKKAYGFPAKTPPQQNDNILKSVDSEGKAPSKMDHQMMTRNLIYYHRKLTNMWVAGGAQKKKKGMLLRKLHSFIGSLSRKEEMSSKMFKKIQKTQEESQTFLVDV